MKKYPLCLGHAHNHNINWYTKYRKMFQEFYSTMWNFKFSPCCPFSLWAFVITSNLYVKFNLN